MTEERLLLEKGLMLGDRQMLEKMTQEHAMLEDCLMMEEHQILEEMSDNLFVGYWDMFDFAPFFSWMTFGTSPCPSNKDVYC